MLSAGLISHTSTHYMDFVEIFNVSLDLSTIYLAHLVGVQLPLCLVATLFRNALSCSLGVKLTTRSFGFISKCT